MKKVLQELFSIKNKNCHKILTICGIKLKFKNKLVFLQNELKNINFALTKLKEDYNTLQADYKEAFIAINKINKHVKLFKSGIINKGLNNKFIVVYEDGTEHINEVLNGVKVCFAGDNNIVKIIKPKRLRNCIINCSSNNVVILESSPYTIQDFCIAPVYPMSNGNQIHIGKNFSCQSCNIWMHDETNQKIVIGDDCMFSYDITIWPSDGHAIIDLKNKNVINNIQNNLLIGNHVWLGKGSTILKNVRLANNTIVAAESVINKRYTKENTILAGIPAKVVKEDITWVRENTENYRGT